MGIFQIGRFRLHYEDLGSGRPIVMIHGFTNYGLSWTPQLAALVHSGYRVIVPDLRGHGASTGATALCTVADFANDLIELLDQLDINSAALCGLSLGGMIGLQLAIEQPDRVAALVVANSRASFPTPKRSRLSTDGRACLPSRTGLASACVRHGPCLSTNRSAKAPPVALRSRHGTGLRQWWKDHRSPLWPAG